MKVKSLVALVISVLMLVNIVPITVFASTTEESMTKDTMEISVSSTTAMPGDTVQVDINLKNNPGLASLKIAIEYDDVLTLTDVSFNSEFGAYVTSPEPYTNPQTITMISPLRDVTTDGVFATLTFKVSETAKDAYSANVSIEYNDEDIYNGSYTNLDPEVINGSIMIYHAIPGDIDGDMQVNNKDAILLFRYISGWDVSVDPDALDVNGDNKINTKDAVELFRYAAGWDDVNIYRGKICTHEFIYTPAIAATCLEDGNYEYWTCTLCDRIYSDDAGNEEISLHDTAIPMKGHTEVVDEAIPATYDTVGLTEGAHCLVCNAVIIAQKEIPKLSTENHSITYRNLKTAEYPVQTSYAEHSGLLELPTPIADGYKFVGWYTASVGGDLVDYISAGDTKDYILFARWEIETYTITYKDAPVPNNQTTYTVEDDVVLAIPQWNGLVFSHWTDKNGNVCTKINKGTTGDLELTANWKRLQNIATPAIPDEDLIVVYDEDAERYHFIYPLGTIEHVVLEKISLASTNLKYNSNAMDLSFELTDTVSIEDSIANSIAEEISKSLSQSSEWAQTKEWAKSHSETESWENKISIGLEAKLPWGKIKGSITGTKGGSETDETSWGESTSSGGSQSSGSETTNSLASTISYKKEISSAVTTSITISKDMPAGYYSYVHAGNIRVYAIVTYDPTTESYYLDTYSILDNMHEMMLYYRDVNELNNASFETLAFEVPTTKIENYFSTSLYNVEYDANGGEGTMHTSVLSNDMSQSLYPNQFTKTGYTFVGWELRTDNGVERFEDQQKVTNLAAKGETVTLTAIWIPNTYDIVYDANTGDGTMEASSHTYDLASVLTTNGFSKIGYSFVGWSTNKDGSGTLYADGDSVMNLTADSRATVTLYAIWKINTYTITFMLDDGTVVKRQQYDYNSLTDASISPTSPKKAGFDFDGWFFAGTAFILGNSMPAQDLIATPMWKYKIVNYESDRDDKTIDASHTYDLDKFSISELAVFMNDGYKFRFTINLRMRELEAGYQEIYLVNSNGKIVDDVYAFEYGGSGKDTAWGNQEFVFTVDAENCTNDMLLRYGAHGENSDDWKCGKVTVTVEVIEEN